MPRLAALGIVGLVTVLSLLTPAAGAERRLPGEVALAVDQQLAAELKFEEAALAPRVSDETWLRRVSLDIVGRAPSVAELSAFVLDPGTDKRAKAVERLLADRRYGENWGRYWRDVIMYRRSEERALISAGALTQYLTEQLNQNTPWDKLAASFITATGEVTEDGSTGLIMAQSGRPDETASEIARIFMGIQIQCAQCHDHPIDQWKREQFHELAAFFPRVAVRQNRDGDRRTFNVVAEDNFPRFQRLNPNNRFRGTAEHYMPNLDDPSARGKLMQPVFFVSGQKVRLGTKDEDRRGKLAQWLTSPENEWFAKAIVNRLWSELVGEGFYEPVDDMGPERDCTAPETLEHLPREFVASGHDLKWLMATIISTEAYQRQSQPRRQASATPLVANVSQPLRAEQLYSNLTLALGSSDVFGAGGRGRFGFQRGPRNPFNQAFGYDPSLPRDEVAGSIPQALLMMNSPVVNQAINARSTRTELGRLLSKTKDNRQVVIELYLRTLSRQPTESEIQTALNYLTEVNGREEAFEDLQWALVNSAEFLHRK